MSCHPLRAFIEKYTPLSNGDWEQINTRLEQQKLKKGTLILSEGQVCRYLYFLEEGLLRYYITKEDREYTKYFTISPYLFTSQLSFTSQQPSKENIEALETGTLWRMTLHNANDLLRLKSWSTFIRKLVQQVQFYTDNILEEIQTKTAEHRYLQMLSSNPEWLQRIPLKHLASYLGVAPQSLSRIRKKSMKKLT